MPSYIFPSGQRIRQRKDFEQAFVQKGLTNKWFTIYVADSKQIVPRLGMVVSKRVMAKSVSRNFAKRTIREVFRLNSSQLPARDFVVRIRRNLTKESSVEAREALLKLMLENIQL